MANILHVLNGDAARYPLEASGAPGVFTIWADPLHDGPVPADLDADDLLVLRARHLAGAFEKPYGEVIETLREWNAALDRWGAYDEVVFWFEHDLFDQLILVRHLDWLARINPPAGRFSLICIGEHPGHPDFDGLGQLSPGEMLALLPSRQPITAQQIDTGRAAWESFRADDPTVLVSWLRSMDSSGLPFLPGALDRHLDELPGLQDGLSRSERQILQVVSRGATTFGQVFRATQQMEERVFMGDVSFRRILQGMTGGPHPLLAEAEHRFSLTEDGAEVLGGRADNIALNGIDRWMGGVHLTPGHLWRWDANARTLVSRK
jgi:hypothetical protein